MSDATKEIARVLGVSIPTAERLATGTSRESHPMFARLLGEEIARLRSENTALREALKAAVRHIPLDHPDEKAARAALVDTEDPSGT